MSIVIHKQIMIMCILVGITSLLCAEKKAVFIIGPGRCGSSCTAGLLEILGLPLGDSFLTAGTIAQHSWNPKGFFEDLHTLQLLDLMLIEMTASALTPIFIDWNNHPQRADCKLRIKNDLQKRFNTFSSFGIKSPPMALFLPLYYEAAQELGYTPKIIVIKRNTEEVYASWKNIWHTVLTDNQVVEAVDCYLKAISFYAPLYDHIEVEFNDVIHNTKMIVEKFNRFLPELKLYENVENEIKNFIDKDLKHYNAHPTRSGTLFRLKTIY